MEQEYNGTCSWAVNNVQTNPVTGEQWYLGWHATIGDRYYAPHMPPTYYGWNAGALGSVKIALEFCQPHIDVPITQGQIESAVHYTLTQIRPTWPTLVEQLIQHAPSMIEEHWQTDQGRRDGKSDVDPRHPDQLENRYWELLKRVT